MNIFSTEIPDVKVIEPVMFDDGRGFFCESFNEGRYRNEVGISARFVQDNHSHSTRNVLRGLHYQVGPAQQGKLVRVVRGEVFDVAVDLRRSSPTFGRWVGVFLSEDNKRQLWIPTGFAHGFLVISEVADFCYKVTDYWQGDAERCLLWNDPDVGIQWPLKYGHPSLSEKDKAGTPLQQAECFQ